MNIPYLLNRPHEWLYYIKCLLWKKYNIVKIKTLSPTWNDRDKTKTLPKEERFTEVDRNGCKMYLMNINKYEREFCRKVSRLKKEMDDELTKKLIELIKIRRHLWT
jgi:hypothetical protein